MIEIIQKAIEGGWEKHGKNGGSKTTDKFMKVDVLDPLFWQALGKACGWELGKTKWDVATAPQWLEYSLQFHEINLTEGWDKAVSYLEELIIK